MSQYKYQPYYQYNGPTHSQPLREKLSSEDIEYNLEYFFSEIERYFEEGTASFEKFSETCIEITTELSEAECDERVKSCLNNLDLYAHKACKN